MTLSHKLSSNLTEEDWNKEHQANKTILGYLAIEVFQVLKSKDYISIDEEQIKQIVRYCSYGQSKNIAHIIVESSALGEYYRNTLQKSIQENIQENPKSDQTNNRIVEMEYDAARNTVLFKLL